MISGLMSLDGGDRNAIRDLWDTLSPWPLGKRLFGAVVCRAVPYTGTISPRVVALRDGYAEVELRDHHRVRNHLRSVHAVALANLAEFTGNLALMYSLPDDARFIVKGMQLRYEKKARGTMRARCESPKVASSDKQTYPVEVEILNAEGDRCVVASLETLVGPKK